MDESYSHHYDELCVLMGDIATGASLERCVALLNLLPASRVRSNSTLRDRAMSLRTIFFQILDQAYMRRIDNSDDDLAGQILAYGALVGLVTEQPGSRTKPSDMERGYSANKMARQLLAGEWLASGGRSDRVVRDNCKKYAKNFEHALNAVLAEHESGPPVLLKHVESKSPEPDGKAHVGEVIIRPHDTSGSAATLDPLSIASTIDKARRTPRVDLTDTYLQQKASDLAKAVRRECEREERLRRVTDPLPSLSVRWANAAEDNVDYWEHVTLGDSREPIDLRGHFDEVVGVFDKIPSGRLVVLGKPGSGKTMLATRFALQLIEQSEPNMPVPVVFRLSSWNPATKSLQRWIIEELTARYRTLAAKSDQEDSPAVRLIQGGWILPVLDGFDEIAPGLQAKALESINANLNPGDQMLLTSRTDDYVAALQDGRVRALASAAVIQLKELTVEQLADYLPRTSRKQLASGQITTKWHPVIEQLCEYPEESSSANLLAALSTPLMVSLARAIYSDTPGHDPQELLDTNRFAESSSLEDHLLDKYVDAVYEHPLQDNEGDEPFMRVRASDARQWLGFLAIHLHYFRSSYLAWWQLEFAVPRFIFALSGVLASIPCVLVFLIGDTADADLTLVRGVTLALFASWITIPTPRGAKDSPLSRITFRVRGRSREIFSDTLFLGTIGTLMVIMIGGLLSLLASLIGSDNPWGLFELTVFSAIAFVLAFAGALHSMFIESVDVWRSTDVRSSLGAIRRVALVEALLMTPVFGTGVWFVFLQGSGMIGSSFSFWLIFFAWISIFPIHVLTTTWGEWALSRFWLALTGRLPWNLIRFLEDAHRRGVLRQAAGMYQFRHALLHDRLALQACREERFRVPDREWFLVARLHLAVALKDRGIREVAEEELLVVFEESRKLFGSDHKLTSLADSLRGPGDSIRFFDPSYSYASEWLRSHHGDPDEQSRAPFRERIKLSRRRQSRKSKVRK